jgi:hypothetical protein
MPTNRTPKTAPKPKTNRVSRGVIAGLKEAIAHARGEISLPVRYYDVPGRVDVKAIRAKSKSSQAESANRYGLTVDPCKIGNSAGRNRRVRSGLISS